MLYLIQATVRFGPADKQQISVLQAISPGKRIAGLVADFEETIEANLVNGEVIQMQVSQLQNALLAFTYNKYLAPAIPPNPIEVGFSFQ